MNRFYRAIAALLLFPTLSSGSLIVLDRPAIPTATALAPMGRDSSANSFINNLGQGQTLITAAAGTTTLTVASTFEQIVVNGGTTQTIKLPVASTMTLGMGFYIVNANTGVVTVQSSGANTVQAMVGASTDFNHVSTLFVFCILTSGTGTASWQAMYSPDQESGAVASTLALRDTNKNIAVNNLLNGFTTTATAGGTTVLATGTTWFRQFTGTLNQRIDLPDTSFLSTGGSVFLSNRSTGTLSVYASDDTTLIQTMAPASQALFTGTTSGNTWNVAYTITGVVTQVGPTVQTFTSSSGTYTRPTGVQFIRVRMVGGGGGGGSGGTAVLNAGGTGGNSTFGSSLLTANGGVGGGTAAATGYSTGGAGGTATIAGGALGTATAGAQGGGNDATPTGAFGIGGYGGASPFGGSSAPVPRAAGGTVIANTGSGGAGGSTSSSAGGAGAGGGAGGFIDSTIVSPSATYSYAVGAAGAASTGSPTNGFVGAAGSAGYIEVTEFYSNVSIGTATSVAANLILAGPTSGSAANPGFRNMVGADTLSQGTVTLYTASSTFTTPSTSTTSTKYSYIILGGGGGGGGANGAGAAGGGGGAGAFAYGTFTGVAASTGITVTIGASGSAGTNTGGTGGTGGSSSLGSPVSITCTGGVGGTGSTSATNVVVAGGAGGTVSVGSPTLGLTGATGGYGALQGGAIGQGGFGASAYGGYGLGGFGTQVLTAFGGSAAGIQGQGYGSGGGGGVSTTSVGFAGATGVILITQLTP